MKLNLNKPYISDKLLFYIDNDTKYTISLYRDLAFEKITLSKTVENEKISIPDDTWITEDTMFYTYITYEKLDESGLTELTKETTNCSYREKYVYKYEVTKEYYDDNYHLNVDDYIKDINDYKIYYKNEPFINAVEIIQEKLIEVPQIEYVYTEKEIKENDSSQQTEVQEVVKTETITEIKKEIVEKEVFKIPKKVYIIILILLIISTLLIIKLYRKNVE